MRQIVARRACTFARQAFAASVELGVIRFLDVRVDLARARSRLSVRSAGYGALCSAGCGASAAQRARAGVSARQFLHSWAEFQGALGVNAEADRHRAERPIENSAGRQRAATARHRAALFGDEFSSAEFAFDASCREKGDAPGGGKLPFEPARDHDVLCLDATRDDCPLADLDPARRIHLPDEATLDSRGVWAGEQALKGGTGANHQRGRPIGQGALLLLTLDRVGGVARRSRLGLPGRIQGVVSINMLTIRLKSSFSK